jgi:hypothetical protein
MAKFTEACAEIFVRLVTDSVVGVCYAIEVSWVSRNLNASSAGHALKGHGFSRAVTFK